MVSEKNIITKENLKDFIKEAEKEYSKYFLTKSFLGQMVQVSMVFVGLLLAIILLKIFKLPITNNPIDILNSPIGILSVIIIYVILMTISVYETKKILLTDDDNMREIRNLENQKKFFLIQKWHIAIKRIDMEIIEKMSKGYTIKSKKELIELLREFPRGNQVLDSTLKKILGTVFSISFIQGIYNYVNKNIENSDITIVVCVLIILLIIYFIVHIIFSFHKTLQVQKEEIQYILVYLLDEDN